MPAAKGDSPAAVKALQFAALALWLFAATAFFGQQGLGLLRLFLGVR